MSYEQTWLFFRLQNTPEITYALKCNLYFYNKISNLIKGKNSAQTRIQVCLSLNLITN